jgi:hypothetical protein
VSAPLVRHVHLLRHARPPRPRRSACCRVNVGFWNFRRSFVRAGYSAGGTSESCAWLTSLPQ